MNNINEFSIGKDEQYRGEIITESKSTSTDDMTVIIRETDHACEIHARETWETSFETKVGVESKKEYSDIWNSLDWNEHHAKWDSDRVGSTNMWECDLDSLFVVILLFAEHGVEMSVTEDVWKKYLEENYHEADY